MALLSDVNKAKVLEEWMNYELGPIGVTKDDLRDAVVALDQFLENNKGNINSAIPEPARSNLTTRQKIFILRVVLDRRLKAGSDN